MLIFLIILALAVLAFMLYFFVAFRTGAPFWPSGRKTIAQMLALANPKPGELLIDLGSGDGRILFAAAKLGMRAIGVEMNPFFVWWSRARGAHVMRGDLWNTDVSSADIVTIYFIHAKMKQLQDKLQKEMKPGSRVISNKFTFPDWQAEAKDGKVHLYAIHPYRRRTE